MRPWNFTLILLIVTATLIFAVVWREVHHGFSARSEPSAIETFVATAARKMAVPSIYKNLRNPLPPSHENVQAGMEHFADHCSTCHANDGSGDTLFGDNLYPKPPDLRSGETQHKTDGELYYTIQNGVRLSGMPAFGQEHGTGETDTWKLVLFIRRLPKLTSDELQEMKQLNPKTDVEREEEQEEEQFLSGEEAANKSEKRRK